MKGDFNISVVLTVRNRTQIVRFRTLLYTLQKSLMLHYQCVNALAWFLLYNKYGKL